LIKDYKNVFAIDSIVEIKGYLYITSIQAIFHDGEKVPVMWTSSFRVKKQGRTDNSLRGIKT